MTSHRRFLSGPVAGVCLLVFGCAGKNADENYVTTESGLKYADLRQGTGEQAKLGDFVTVHYTGWLKGEKFQSSRDRNFPVTFGLGTEEVIKGWDEGVAGMKVGGKRKLVIPPHLGYGTNGGSGIPPDTELTFEIELLEIKRQR
jgi:FKBP-type peptidyl-prolyl cis-trans isomerase